MKKIISLLLLVTIILFGNVGMYTYATGESSTSSSSSGGGTFEIIPKSEVSDETVGKAVETVGKAKDGVWKEYNSQASSLQLGGQFASGIMNWDTILNYSVYLVRFFFQLGLFIGAVMIVYAGYLYTMGVFGVSGKGTSEGTTAIKLAIGGSLVVLFSYAIMKILTSMFL